MNFVLCCIPSIKGFIFKHFILLLNLHKLLTDHLDLNNRFAQGSDE